MYQPLIIRSQAGIKRDGSVFEGEYYVDGQWVRFQRGLPRKILGYRTINKYLPEITRGVRTFTQNNSTYVYIGSANYLSQFTLDASTNPSIVFNRTPVSLNTDPMNLWQFDIMVDNNQVPPRNQLIAQVAPNTTCICNAEGGQLFFGEVTATTPLTPINVPPTASATGGVVALHPYLFYFGNDGSLGWSAPGRPDVLYLNEFEDTNLTVTGAYNVGDVVITVTNAMATSFVMGDIITFNTATSTQYQVEEVIFGITTIAIPAITTAVPAGTLIYLGTVATTFRTANDLAVGATSFSLVGTTPTSFAATNVIRFGAPDATPYTIATAAYAATAFLQLTYGLLAPLTTGAAIFREGTQETGAGFARVASQKIVRGLPLRGGGGNSPAGLFWSLDAVIRASFVGGDLTFQFDTITVNSSILSSNSVIEQDGVYYWVGTDRFLLFNGVVRDLANNLNINWFFDNVNYNQAQKIFAFRVPKYSEIWWCFPFGDATECTHAVIYNIRENTWYDTKLPNDGRSVGEFANVLGRPLLGGVDPNIFFNPLGNTGDTSYPISTANISIAGDLTVELPRLAQFTFTNSGNPFTYTVLTSSYNQLTDMTSIGFSPGLIESLDANSTLYLKFVGYNFWIHETGVNEINVNNEYPVDSYIETSDIAMIAQTQAKNKTVGVSFLEPDFVQSGDMSVQIRGQANARAPVVIGDEQVFSETATKIADQVVYFKEQRRILRFRFRSNTIGGNFQWGQVIAHISESDGTVLGG